MSSDEPLGLHNLPPEILIRIFVELNFGERIQLERVCSTWRKLALAWAWRETRILKATDEYRNYKSTRPSRSLGRLSALLRRYGPNLEELHVGWGISVDTRFGRYFRHLAVHGKLAHLRVEEPLDVWHLDQIREHLGPMLVSLSIRLNKSRKRTTKQKKAALANLLANCPKLECVQMGDLDDLFSEDELRIPLLPPTVKYLHISDVDEYYYQYMETDRGDEATPALVRILLANLPAIQFFLPFIPYKVNELNAISQIDYSNHNIFRQQWPICFARNYDTLQIQMCSPKFNQILALQIAFEFNLLEIPLLANHFPQLEHLDLRLEWNSEWAWHQAPIRDLEALHHFKHLTSLALTIELRHFTNFDRLECTTGEPAEPVLLEILTRLNEINALRSLHFKAFYENNCHYPDFSDEFLFQLMEKLPHLETFASAFFVFHNHSCPYPRREHFCYRINSAEYIQVFCDKLKAIFDGQMEQFRGRQKSFKFTITQMHGRPESTLFVKWAPDCGRIEWKHVPRRKYNYCGCEIYCPARSVVLNEMLEKMMGQRTRRFLFDDINDW